MYNYLVVFRYSFRINGSVIKNKDSKGDKYLNA